MKKILHHVSLTVVLLLVLALSVPAFAAASVPEIRIDNKVFSVPASAGGVYVNSKGMTQVPLAAFAQALGCKVSTDSSTKRLVITRPDNIQVKIGAGESYIETPYGVLKMNTTAESKNGHLFIPVSYASEILGYSANVQNGTKSVVNVTKSPNSISLNIDPIYKYYKLFLTGTMTGGATADLDKDGMPELITITRDSMESDLYISVYKGTTLMGSMSLSDACIDTAPANYPELGIYKDTLGKEYLGISGGRSNQYGNSEELYLYAVKSNKLVSIGGFSCYDGSGEKSSTINGKKYKGVAKYKQAIAPYKLAKKMAELHPYDGTGDYTSGGSNVKAKYPEEERLWNNLLKTAVPNTLQKIKFGMTKELVGFNIGENMDMSNLKLNADGDGTTVYSINQGTGAGQYLVYLSGNTLSSLYAAKGADVFGVVIGKDGAVKIQQVFGIGTTIKNASGRYMAPTGAVSSRYYHAGEYQIEFFLDKNGVAIGAFIRQFEGKEPI